MSLKSNLQKRTLDRLTKRNVALEESNKKLIDENKKLEQRIVDLEDIISKVQTVEADYFSGLEEIKVLRKKYIAIINEANNAKLKYSKETKSMLKQFRKEL